MALDEKIYELRKEKLKQIEALGGQAYPYTYNPTHTVPEILAQYGESTGEQLSANRVDVRVAGRIMAINAMGKAAFVRLQQGGERLQIYIKKDAVGEKGFQLYKLLDIGDHIGARGYLFRTKTNELTVHVDEITFLAKDLLTLPEKWHGLQDVELRYRQRYVDLTMNSEVREVFVKRARIIQSLRHFFDARGFVEVETPMMHSIAGGAAARPFVTHHNTLDMDLYLRIAPELYLKRLIVGGLERVYEINRNFRNEGISTHHNPEFTMLEFYQAYADYRDLMTLSEELLRQIALDVNGSTICEYDGRQIDWSRFERLSMREAIIKYWPEAAGINRRCRISTTQPRSPRWRGGFGRLGLICRSTKRSCRQNDRRHLRGRCRRALIRTDDPLRLPTRDLSTFQSQAWRARLGRALRDLCGRHGDWKRFQRAERSRGAAPALRAATRTARARRRGSTPHGRCCPRMLWGMAAMGNKIEEQDRGWSVPVARRHPRLHQQGNQRSRDWSGQGYIRVRPRCG